MSGLNSAKLGPVSGGDARFIEVYNKHFRSVYAYCRRRTDPAKVDDAVAEVFLVCWRRIDEVPDEPKTLPWLYGVAYRVIGQQWRGAGRQQKLTKKLHGVGFEAVTTTDDVVIAREDSRTLSKALARLRPDDLEILRLALWEELPMPEVAEVLGLSEPAIRQRLSRARKRLTNEYNRLESKKSSVARKGGAW